VERLSANGVDLRSACSVMPQEYHYSFANTSQASTATPVAPPGIKESAEFVPAF
jgi:hypothetical protein